MGAMDVKSKVSVARLHAYAQKNATASIQGTEVADYFGSAFFVEVGAHTANGITVTLQESDDNSTWTDIAAADLDGTTGWSQDLAITASNDDTTYVVGYMGNKRYIGAVITDAGSGDVILGVYVAKGFPKDLPDNS